MGAISGDLEKIWNKKQFLLPLIYRLGGRGGGRIFVARTEHLRDPLLQCGFDSPSLRVEYFMILPLLSQSPEKASVAICKQVTSTLILTSHEP